MSFRVAKLFWWFNQGSAAEISVTPKPHYGADGNKVFGIAGTPDGLCESARAVAGPVPVPHVLGTEGRASLHGMDCPVRGGDRHSEHQPELTLVYLPHLDYDPQRFGPVRLRHGAPGCASSTEPAA